MWVPPAMSAQVLERQQSSSSLPEDHIDNTKTLICALSFLSRNLPLPPDVFDAVSSIYTAAASEDADAGVDATATGGSDCDKQVDDASSPVSSLL